jgi:exodeoxyribonuclease VII large subunit
MAVAKNTLTNIPEFSVSELAFSLKRTLEETYGHVRVRGELGRVTVAASGHMYATLKDDQANIDAVCWKGTMSKLSVKPAEGLEVVCSGRITTYPANSKYQLVIDTMELAGQGALLKMLEERRKKLAAEGLFDQDRKKPIPFLPDVIGVITSPTGAVIRDILHRLADRFPRHVLVWPVLVQGANAAEQVTAAIKGFQDIEKHGLPRPDLIIVARGGGSLEDLMPFNEESVVRAAAESKIPLISAVGHETDTTLIDYAADLRAPTPTGAAEMAVPRRIDLLAQVLDDEQRMVSGMSRMLSEARHRLEARAQALGDPRKILDIKLQQIDHAGDKMTRVFREYISLKNTAIITHAAKLRHPRDQFETARKNLVRWTEQLTNAAPKLTLDLQKRVQHAEKMLEAYSFKNVLKRGYAVVKTLEGKLVTDPAQTKPGDGLQLHFKDDKMLQAVVKPGNPRG